METEDVPVARIGERLEVRGAAHATVPHEDRLDELAVDLVPIPDRDDYDVLVKYETFMQGRAEKVRKT